PSQGDQSQPWFPPAAGQPPTGFPEPPAAEGSGGPFGQAGPYGAPGPYGPPGPPGTYGQQPPPYAQPGLPGPPGPYGYPPRARPTAPKPGVIALRPISAGEILDGAVTAIRRNPRATLGLGAMIMTIYGVVAAIAEPSAVGGFTGFSRLSGNQAHNQAQLRHQLSNFGHQITGLLVTYLILIVASQILTGMLTVVIGRSVLGDRVTVGAAWRQTLPRLPAMFGAIFLYFLVFVGIWAVYLGIGVVIRAGLNASGPVLAIYFVVVGIAVLCLTVWLWTSFLLASQVVVLERTGPVRALGRSWRLVRRSWWRVFGIVLLAGLIVGLAGTVLQLPFSVPAGLITSHAGTPLHPPTAAVIIGTVGLIVARTVTGALQAGIYVLLYVDLRMRKEGLDMALRTAAGGSEASGLPGDEFATVWRPPSR
ncbi:MAG: hypothetical protein WAK82_24265, partial [Streptosporangiaceae bacterium]